MNNDIELGKQLVDELTDLWLECSERCDKIEELIKKINDMRK